MAIMKVRQIRNTCQFSETRRGYMVTKLNKNVLMVQDVPSNLIEQVILILKTEEPSIKAKTKEILMTEAQEIIQDCSSKLQSEREEKRKREREEANQRQRRKANWMALVGFLLFTASIIFLARAW